MKYTNTYKRFYKNKADQRKSEGLCAACGKNPLKTKSRCEPCLLRQRGYSQDAKGQRRELYKQNKLKILKYYGGNCACCQESRYEFLSIDHIYGGGNQHRHRDKTARNIYYWITKNKFPEGFQVLCHNCNMAKGFFGECPHIKERYAKDTDPLAN